jgi:AcrR family transcriptional regulator
MAAASTRLEDGTDTVAERPAAAEHRRSLRADQVAQTRSALVAAGRRRFGRDGFAATSVDDLAREARVSTGALYHHFRTKTALFEAVFEEIHSEFMQASARAAVEAPDPLESLARGFAAFLEAVLEPDVQQIMITDAPAVLGLARFTELDERYALDAIVGTLKAAEAQHQLHIEDPETLARLLLGGLTRGAMLIANSAKPKETRDVVAKAIRAVLTGLAATTER